MRGLTFGDILRIIRNDGLENALYRFYSLYQATVTDDVDPSQQGRVRVCVDGIGLKESQTNLSWPVSPYAGRNYGFYFPPHQDEQVFVSFEMGDTSTTRVMGSWWRNKDETGKAENSEVPVEFVDTSGSSPTKRGIKTRGGHGLLFEDKVDEQRVEIWTGLNPTDNGAPTIGQAATKHHTFVMDDKAGDEQVVLTTFGGHSTTWKDKTGEVYVETKTKDGHSFLMSDTDNRVLLQLKNSGHSILLDGDNRLVSIVTESGHSVSLNDLSQQIQVRSVGQNSVSINDLTQQVQVSTSGGRNLLLDDEAGSNTLLNQANQAITQQSSGTTIVDPGTLGLTATSTLDLTGSGVNITAGADPSVNTYGGTLVSKHTGTKTDVMTGGWIANIVGSLLFSMGAGLMTFAAPSVLLGTGSGGYKFLVNADFFTAYLSHTHTTTVAGAPTGAPITGLPIVGTHTTTETAAS